MIFMITEQYSSWFQQIAIIPITSIYTYAGTSSLDYIPPSTLQAVVDTAQCESVSSADIGWINTLEGEQ